MTARKKAIIKRAKIKAICDRISLLKSLSHRNDTQLNVELQQLIEERKKLGA